MSFTASKFGKTYILDSFSENYNTLKNKFPNEIIYKSDKPIKSVYLTRQQLVKANG